jgi:uncharacterized protein
VATLDRLRGIVQGARPSAVPALAPDAQAIRTGGPSGPPPDHARAALMLGGAVLERPEGAVIIVDREYRASALHGRLPVGEIVSVIHEGREALALMAEAWPAAKGLGAMPGGTDVPPLLFLDLETTGLFGGAGTQAFLIGCAAIDGDAIHVRQFLLPGFEHERAVLHEVQAWAARHGALCTYNGRSFDAPLVETRFMFHRLPCPLDGMPHLDMLHAARRLWRDRPAVAGPDPDASSCTLGVLEKRIAGLHRVGDVPGYEIPSRYFQFVRDGDARPLEAVLEHNRLDLVSLAAVLARAITLMTRGPEAAATAQEAYGLARVYERAGAFDNAEAALLKTVAMVRRIGVDPELHAEALRRLAWLRRRARRAHEAAEAWRELASLPRCAAALRREAREALAIHYEHRSKDLGVAHAHALELLADGAADTERVRHRIERLERKLARHAAATGSDPPPLFLGGQTP